MNTAVYYSAAVLANIITRFVGCDNIGTNPPTDQGGQGQGQQDKTSVQLRIDESMGLMVFSMTGLFATGIALVILNQVDLLEKLLLS